MCTPMNHVTKCLWAHNWNLLKILFTLMFIFMIQSSHNFPHVTAAVVACAKLWPDWIIIFHVRVTQNVAMFNNEFMNESFVKWASGHVWYKYMVQTPMPFIINRDLLGHVPSFPHVWSCDQPDTKPMVTAVTLTQRPTTVQSTAAQEKIPWKNFLRNNRSLCEESNCIVDPTIPFDGILANR